jgi:hypothetical protein
MNRAFGLGLTLCLLSAISVIVTSGCGRSKPSNLPKTIPVKGTVTYKSSPVEGATVSFMPQDPKGKGAVAQTDKSGQYRLATPGVGDGVMPGAYRVKIAKTTSQSRLSEEQEKQYMAKGKQLPPNVEKDELPVKYKQEATSKLTADVKEGGKPIDFDLTD